KLLGRQVLKVHYSARVLTVEIAVRIEEFRGRHVPCLIAIFALAPPHDAVLELFELHRLGLGVVLSTLRQGLLVIPHVFRWPGTVEEEDVSRDIGIWREHTVWQADDSMEVELLEQFFLDPGANTITE